MPNCIALAPMPRARGQLASTRLRPSCAQPRVFRALVCEPQRAAASKAFPWVSKPVEGAGVRTGGRLHPGQPRERLLKQRPKVQKRANYGGLAGVGAWRFPPSSSATVFVASLA